MRYDAVCCGMTLVCLKCCRKEHPNPTISSRQLHHLQLWVGSKYHLHAAATDCRHLSGRARGEGENGGVWRHCGLSHQASKQV